MKKLIGTILILIAFTIGLGIFYLLGGDEAQSHRSEWFPLLYIVPLLISVFGFFWYTDKKNWSWLD